MASHVAEFEVPAPQPPPQQIAYQQHPHQMHMMQQHPMYPNHSPYAVPGQPYVKSEPADSRGLNPIPNYAMPALPGPPPGPQLAGPRLPNPGGHQSVLSFPPGPPQPLRGPNATAYGSPAPQQQQPQPQRIPQVDGPSSSSDSDEETPPPSQTYAPHTSHPSLPQPTASGSTQPDDSEAINSDLDDSDTGDEEEAEDGGAGESDIVFCTYDKVNTVVLGWIFVSDRAFKVARVKNKWKCILKDGMIHINGKDYLFAKCTG